MINRSGLSVWASGATMIPDYQNLAQPDASFLDDPLSRVFCLYNADDLTDIADKTWGWCKP